MTPRSKGPVAPRRDRSGHYATPRGRFMSVTTILSKGIPKENLVHWAASEVALCALDNLPRLVRVRGQAQRDETYDWLRRAAETKRDTAASLGSAVHAAVEAQILGQPGAEPTPEQQPFLAAFERFCSEWRPEWEATELVVANPDDGWAGTADWWARLPGLGSVVVLGDWKTGKGVYAEAALQLSAYRRATVGWLRDGTEIDPPRADRAVVVHLRPDKHPSGYAVIPMDTSDQTYADFLSAKAIADYRIHRADNLLGDPLTPAEGAA